MSEIEQLQEVIQRQEQEIQRLHQLLAKVSIAMVGFEMDDRDVVIRVTCIGVDQCAFVEKTKAELIQIVEHLTQGHVAQLGEWEDVVSGEPVHGISDGNAEDS